MRAEDVLPTLRAVNATAAFNRWAGFEVVSAEVGLVRLRAPWRPEFAQYAGSLHAGLVSALVDTACGFAAATVAPGDGRVTASHCAVSYLAPATGGSFLATARVVRAGRRQAFVSAELHAEHEDGATLVATGTTILVPLSSGLEQER